MSFPTLIATMPTFARVRLTGLGSIEELDDAAPTEVGEIVTLWTRRVNVGDNPFATVQIRGVLDGDRGLAWLPEDATGEIVEPPRFAGAPEDLIGQAVPIKAPPGSKGVMKTADGWPDLIWRSDIVYSPVQGWSDAELAVQVLLCALTVAPVTGDPKLRPMLLAALKARYLVVTRDPQTYPAARYPWRAGPAVPASLLEYLEG